MEFETETGGVICTSEEDLQLPPRKEIFREITSKLFDTYCKKNADYGSSFETLFKEHGMIYSIIHLEEKLNRIKSLQEKGNQVEGESFKDSLEDLANYAILTLIELDVNK